MSLPRLIMGGHIYLEEYGAYVAMKGNDLGERICVFDLSSTNRHEQTREKETKCKRLWPRKWV